MSASSNPSRSNGGGFVRYGEFVWIDFAAGKEVSFNPKFIGHVELEHDEFTDKWRVTIAMGASPIAYLMTCAHEAEARNLVTLLVGADLT